MLVDFTTGAGGTWRSVNDGVMGGLSTGTLRRSNGGSALFEGSVSFENNGGFASVRTSIGEQDLSAYEGLEIRIRGDGHRYRLRLHDHARLDGIAFQADFHSGIGEWHDVGLQFGAFRPSFRGRTPADAPALDTRTIRQIGLMIADRQEGSFRLEIAWIRAYRTGNHHAGADD